MQLETTSMWYERELNSEVCGMENQNDELKEALKPPRADVNWSIQYIFLEKLSVILNNSQTSV